ncbi:hypothetical protein DWB63_02530 [Pseudodesulfovibrio sp. S3]|nr:hypothetical protein DWB63_02530 [Pseudodesulfovibrio sp. S3]
MGLHDLGRVALTGLSVMDTVTAISDCNDRVPLQAQQPPAHIPTFSLQENTPPISPHDDTIRAGFFVLNSGRKRPIGTLIEIQKSA